MSYGDTPPSFSSTGKNGYDQDQPAWDDYIKPLPSFGSVGHGQGNNSHNHFENKSTVDDTKAPSLPAFGHGTRNSCVDGNTNRELDVIGDGQPPSLGAMVKTAVSQTSDAVDHYNHPKGPSLSDVNKRGSSQNGISDQEIVMLDAPGTQELVGMSLVGPNFRKFYPNAYYKEKDGEKN